MIINQETKPSSKNKTPVTDIFAESLSPMQIELQPDLNQNKAWQRKGLLRKCNFFPRQVSPTNTGTHMASVQRRKNVQLVTASSWNFSKSQIFVLLHLEKSCSSFNVPVFVYSAKQIRFFKFILYSGEEMK